jgi:hypothetical protein
MEEDMMSSAATVVEDDEEEKDEEQEDMQSPMFPAEEEGEMQEVLVQGERCRGDSGRWSFDDSERPKERPKRGRKEHVVWTQFKKTQHGVKKTHPDATCIHCKMQINNGKPGDNLKKHLLDHCDKITTVQKMAVMRMYNMPMGDTTGVDKSADGNQATPTLVLEFANEHDFHLYYARQIFAHNLPLYLVESKIWRHMFKVAFPKFKLPTREKLANELLDAVYAEVQEATQTAIRTQQFVSIVTDGWANPNRESIVNYVVVAPGMKSLLWSTKATGAEAHDAENLKLRLQAVIDEIEDKTKVTVAGVNTDNADAPIKSWPLLEEERSIFGGGCAAHTLNLLMNDMLALAAIAAVVAKAMHVIRFVRDHHAMQYIFNELKDDDLEEHHDGLSIPCPTCWYSTVNALESVLSNEKVLERLFVGTRKEDTERRYGKTPAQREGVRKVQALWVVDSNGMNFFTKLKETVNLFEPIITALKVLESDKAWVSDAYEQFKALLVHPAYGKGNPQQTTLQKAFSKAIQKCWNFVHTDGMRIGFLLDPRMNVDEFVGTDKVDTIDQALKFMTRDSKEHPGMLKQLGAEPGAFLDDLYKFLADKKNPEVIKRDQLRSVSPRNWWLHHGSKYPLVEGLAKYVFALPTSTGAAERVWSVLGNIHSKKKSNTAVDRAEKLAYIFTNHNFKPDAMFVIAPDQLPVPSSNA